MSLGLKYNWKYLRILHQYETIWNTHYYCQETETEICIFEP